MYFVAAVGASRSKSKFGR